MLSLEPCDASSSAVHQVDQKVWATTHRVIIVNTVAEKRQSKHQGSECIAERIHAAQLFLSYLYDVCQQLLINL